MSRSKQDPFVINPPPSTNGGNLRQRFQKLEQQHPSQRLRTHSHRHFSNVFLPRVVDRNWPYHQSKNSIAVTNRNHQSGVIQLLMKDWFHVFLRMHVLKSITFLLGLWTSAILIFAAVYVRIDEAYLNQNCGLGDPGTPISFGTAFAFSLETCTTVGYGLPGGNNGFFQNNCPAVQISIYFQMTWSMMFNAFLLSFFYSKMACSENRANQVVFSDKLCVNVRDFTHGKVLADDIAEDKSRTYDADEVFRNSGVCLNVRCYDIDSANPVVESHARMYMIDKNLKLHVLRLTQPNDEFGGMMYPSLPQEIVHYVDYHSPLAPAKYVMPFVSKTFGLPCRAIDSATGNREEIICPVCGESYGTYARLRKHVRFQQMVEKKDGYPEEGSHLSLKIPDHIPTLTLEDVQEYMSQNLAEIIVVVEGIDPMVSGTFQALQSYKYEDICWDGEFVQCLHIEKNKFSVDMEKFHQVRTFANDSVPSSPETSFISPQDHKRDSKDMDDMEAADVLSA